MASPTYQQLEDNVIAWLHASRRSDIRAALIIGSRARIDRPADQWSDLDFIFFVTDSAAYEAKADWLAQFGEIAIAELEHSSRGDAEWIVVYEDGCKIDVLLATVARFASIDLSPYVEVVPRGARVVLDRAGQLQAAIDQVRDISFIPPTPEDFSRTLRQAWLTALRTTKFARRGDLWRAKQSCDGELKQLLLTMMEWHAQTHGADTWHDGRYLAEWADRVAVESLPATFATYDRSSIQQAVRATIDLLHRVARDVAVHWGFDYPAATAVRVVEWLKLIQQ
jgi:aminoglycoside 6-adenylyltransferase